MGEFENLLKQAKKLSDSEKQKLIQQLLQREDVWSLGHANERYSAYCTYSKDISDLIAKIEVYAHDLPPYVGALTEYLWQIMAAASVNQSKEDQDLLYNAIEKYLLHIKNELRFILVKLYLDTIKGYKKTLRCFNHKAFCVANGTPILQDVAISIKKMKQLRRRAQRIRKGHFLTFSENGNKYVCINYKQVSEIKELTEAVSIAELTVDRCEDKYAKIIANGYSAPFYKKIISILPDVFAFGLALYGLWLLLPHICLLVFS